ncbi:VpsF family polysaccharide biosynthesis protein [uncultured Brevundimonas sp.]|uniref:VpsF family polysaccharide biosynthesis protein n=1 Tax=uncultured Brevundimonas sp. TaxID=213418 RepID=UPI00261B16DA|nr:VpsF family polysaccharide biosynthesis protein [uncultured Brevundimonas sp.]
MRPANVFIIISTLSILFLSNNLLYILGISYMSESGSPIEKLHPSFYITLVGAAVCLLYPPNMNYILATGYRKYSLSVMAAALVVVGWILVSPNNAGELSSPIVTFLTPALFMFMFSRTDDQFLRKTATLIPLFFALNSILGIIGSLTGFNILPRVAGGLIIMDDVRPTALLGHPLVNAQITGVYFLYILLKALKDGFTISKFVQTFLHLAALVTFGGRSALLFALLIGTVYAAYSVILGRAKSIASIGLLAYGGLATIPLALGAGLGVVLLERLTNDGGSADTRWAALQMLGLLSPTEWAIGLTPEHKAAMLLYLQTPYGFESFPVALITNYGLPIALLITVTTFALLFKVARPLGGNGFWLVIYFFLTSASALSIGSKTIVISLFLTIVVSSVVNDAPRRRRRMNSRVDQPGYQTVKRASSEPDRAHPLQA